MSTTQLFEAKPGVPVPAEMETPSLFRYSTWLHVGGGAEGCEEVQEVEGVNACGDSSHFHAWCRLPNPLQKAEIEQRALAAKARRVRQLRDPGTDAHDILQEDFDRLSRLGEDARDQVIDELLQLDFWRDYYEAMMEVRQLEDPNAEDPEEKLYAHIQDDQARFTRLDATPADQRPADEYEELKRHLTSYHEAVMEAQRQRTEPRRHTLGQQPVDVLIEQLRDKRIQRQAEGEFKRVMEVNEWLSCTYRQPGGEPTFPNLEALESAAPEVIEGLQATFVDLKRTAQEAQGN